jgi:hypothetical protein
MEQRQRLLRHAYGRGRGEPVFDGLRAESMPQHLCAFEGIHLRSLIAAADGVVGL